MASQFPRCDNPRQAIPCRDLRTQADPHVRHWDLQRGLSGAVGTRAPPPSLRWRCRLGGNALPGPGAQPLYVPPDIAEVLRGVEIWERGSPREDDRSWA